METNKAEWTKLFDEYETQLQNGNDLTHIVNMYLPKATPEKVKSPQLEKRRSKRQASGNIEQLTRRKSKQAPGTSDTRKSEVSGYTNQ